MFNIYFKLFGWSIEILFKVVTNIWNYSSELSFESHVINVDSYIKFKISTQDGR